MRSTLPLDFPSPTQIKISLRSYLEFIDGTARSPSRELWVKDRLVGHLKSERDLFGSGEDRIIAAQLVEADFRGEVLFIDNADRARYEGRKAAKRNGRDARELDIEIAIFRALRDAGHHVVRQTRVFAGIPDIVDHHKEVIIECKPSCDRTLIFAGVDQLFRYRETFKRFSLALGLPSVPETPWILTALKALGIDIRTPEMPFGLLAMEARQ